MIKNTLGRQFVLPTFFVLFGFLQVIAKDDLQNNAVDAVFVQTPPKIDGIIDDDCWKEAVVIDDFKQREPDTGNKASEKSEFYICYDENYLYVAARCYDDPDKITAKELERDVSLGDDDRIQVIVDTFHDKRNAYCFQIGPLGSIGDGLVSENGAGFNKQWDAIWDGKAKITSEGWEAEIAIPFKSINFKPGQTTWGLKLIRHIKRNLESDYWPEANLDTYIFQISDAGELRGLKGITQGLGIDIRPFGLGGMDMKRGEKSKAIFDAGGDIYWQITPGLKTAVTINTDFAQTEADARRINLTRFGLFFPEKRDFYLDGANYFNFGFAGERGNKLAFNNITYFSRRMGLDNEGNPIPVIWGGKLTGQVGNWNIGVQHTMDKPADGARNLSVARVSRNIGKQSYIGVLGTNGNALDSLDNQVAGLDFQLATSKFKGNKNLALTGYGLKSFTPGVSSGDYSFGAMLKYPNDFFDFRLGYQEIGENYVAGIGFVPRPGVREVFTRAQLGPRPKKWGIRQITPEFELDYITNMSGVLLTREISLKPLDILFNSGDGFAYEAKSNYEYLDEDFKISPKDSITIYSGEYRFWRHSIRAWSARRRMVWLMASYETGDFYDGKRQDLRLVAGYKVMVPLYLGAEYELSDISLSEGDFQAVVYRVSVNILFSPNLTLTNFVQYDNFSESLGWQSRFKWIIKPGNELVLVWNSLYDNPVEREVMSLNQGALRCKVSFNIRL